MGAEPTAAILTAVRPGTPPSARFPDMDPAAPERLGEVGGRPQLGVVDVAPVRAHVAAEGEGRRHRDLDLGEVVLPPRCPPITLERPDVADDGSLDARDPGGADLIREPVEGCGPELRNPRARRATGRRRSRPRRVRREPSPASGSLGRDRPSRAAPWTAAASRSRRARAPPTPDVGTRTHRRRRWSPTSAARRSARRSGVATRAGPGRDRDERHARWRRGLRLDRRPGCPRRTRRRAGWRGPTWRACSADGTRSSGRRSGGAR